MWHTGIRWRVSPYKTPVSGYQDHDIQQIFNPFERIQTQSTRAIQGTGLGLTISHALANLMGGDISCQSQPDVGSNFTLTMMMSAVESPVSIPVLINQNITGYTGARQTILVVDDIVLTLT